MGLGAKRFPSSTPSLLFPLLTIFDSTVRLELWEPPPSRSQPMVIRCKSFLASGSTFSSHSAPLTPPPYFSPAGWSSPPRSNRPNLSNVLRLPSLHRQQTKTSPPYHHHDPIPRKSRLCTRCCDHRLYEEVFLKVCRVHLGD